MYHVKPMLAIYRLISSLIVVIALSLLFLTGCSDVDDFRAERELYCKMVALWETNHTLGWPPYNGVEICRNLDK